MKVTNLVLSVLSFIWLTAHQRLIESISECGLYNQLQSLQYEILWYCRKIKISRMR